MKSMERQSSNDHVFSVIDKTIPKHPICLLTSEDLLGRLGYSKSCPRDLAEFSALSGETIAWLVSDYLLCIQNKLKATPTVRLGIEQFEPTDLFGTKDEGQLDRPINTITSPTLKITDRAISDEPSGNVTCLETSPLSSQMIKTSKTSSQCDLEVSAATPDRTSENQALRLSESESVHVGLIEDALVENSPEWLRSSPNTIKIECPASPLFPINIVKNVQISDEDDDDNDDTLLSQTNNSTDAHDLSQFSTTSYDPTPVTNKATTSADGQKEHDQSGSANNDHDSNSWEDIFNEVPETDFGKTLSSKTSKCTKNREVKCFACEVEYANRSSLLKHIKKTHMVTTPMACVFCGEEIATAALFHQHQLTHFVENCTEKLFVCKFFCNVFLTEKELVIHESTHVQQKAFSCKQCGKTFQYKYLLKQHCRVHTGDKPYVCQICDKAYIAQGVLKTHMLSHAQDQPYKCEICNKTFKSKDSLPIHERLHTGERPFQCKTCGKSFTSGIALRQHGLTHTQERPHLCKVCNKGFKCKSALFAHESVHTGEKPFVCEVCGKAFNRREILNSHKGIHNTEKLYKCKTCERTFQCSSTLRKHELIHKSMKSYLCESCGRAFRFRQGLRQHEQTHTGVKYSCEMCGKVFDQEWRLKSHTCFTGFEEPRVSIVAADSAAGGLVSPPQR